MNFYIFLHFKQIKSGRLEPGVEPDRAILWKKARKRKHGQEVEVVDEDLQGVCDSIVSLLSYAYIGILVGHHL